MKVLITGGAGYVGTTLIPQLLVRGHEVTVYDNLLFSGDYILPFFRNPDFTFIKGDVRDLKTGYYKDFITITKLAFYKAGMRLYNECVILNSICSARLRCSQPFIISKKLEKVHQNVLIFIKP